MFPKSYFAPRYFAPKYWDNGAATGTIIPEDILSAIRAIFVHTPSATTPGGITKLYSKKADDDATRPYAVVEEESARVEFRSDTLYGYEVHLRFRVYAEDLDVAGRLGDALWKDLKGKNPSFVGCLGASPLLPYNDPIHGNETNRGKDGGETYWQQRDCTSRIIRTA
jgi:hypothetical protein